MTARSHTRNYTTLTDAIENVEATLEVPDQPGLYELRYVLHAPLAEHRILARRTVKVE